MPSDTFDGAGSLRAAYEQVAWAATALGPVSSWSPALRQALDVALHTRFPITLLWGPELVCVYNEAFVPLIADKHPAALGAPARDVFPEVWDTIGPMLHDVLAGGDATWMEDLPLPLRRHGRLEESYFTFSYSAVRAEDGTVEGVLDVAAETTQQIIDRRRLELLSRLADRLADARNLQQVRDRSLPLLREASADLTAVDVRLDGAIDDDERLPAAPSSPLGGPDVLLEDTAAGHVAWLPLGEPRSDEPGTAVREHPVLVALLSEHLAPDASYLGFLQLVAASLTHALDRVQVDEADQRTAAAERAGESRVAGVLESMPAAFYSLDAEWRFSYVNAEAEKLIGYRREDAVGRVLWDLFPAVVGPVIEDVYRAVSASGEHQYFEAYYPAPLDAWFEIRVWPSSDGLAVYFLDISDRRAVQEQAERAVVRAALLAEVATELAGTLEVERAVARLPRILVPTLADWCIVTLSDLDGQASWHGGLRDVGSWHVDPALRELVERFAASRTAALSEESSTAQVLRTQQPVVLDSDLAAWSETALKDDEARDLLSRLAPAAAAVLPLLGRGRVLGLLTVFNGAQRGPFSRDDLAALREAAGQVGLALDNARLHGEQRGLAEELQRSLLTELPQPDHLQLAARYSPAAQGTQVGGDWYDAFLVGDGTTSLVVGDVAGHDRGATVAMAQVRNVLRGVARAMVEPPAAVLSALDRAMEDLAVGALTTVVLAKVEQSEQDAARGLRTLRWSSAGHPPPLVIHPGGSAELLIRDADLLLGVAPGTDRHDHTQRLLPGATVLLYTDGLVERRGESLDVGLERLRGAAARLAGLELEAMCDALLDELAGPAEDDVALLAIRTHPEDRPRPPEAGPQRLPSAGGLP